MLDFFIKGYHVQKETVDLCHAELDDLVLGQRRSRGLVAGLELGANCY